MLDHGSTATSLTIILNNNTGTGTLLFISKGISMQIVCKWWDHGNNVGPWVHCHFIEGEDRNLELEEYVLAKASFIPKFHMYIIG